MGMNRLAERLEDGLPPLRVSEVARITGYSHRFVLKLISAGTVGAVRLGSDFRVPVSEARRLAMELRLLE